MKIIYTDGSELETSEIRIEGNIVIASDIYTIDTADIDHIEN